MSKNPNLSAENSKVFDEMLKVIEDANNNIATSGKDEYLFLMQTMATLAINAFNNESTKHELWLNKIEA